MNFRKWLDRYSTDCRLKYNSDATQLNYTSCVKAFLERFDKYSEPKEIPTQEIKEYLLSFKTINTRRANLCAIKSFYEITVGMPNKIDKIPYPKKSKQLPIVLSVEEIQRMFDVCEKKIVYLYRLFSIKILKEIPLNTLPKAFFCYWTSLCVVAGIFINGNI